MDLRIDEEFRQQLFPLSAIEFSFLEQSIIKDGCRDPIEVWDGVIVDGHNRYEICTRNDVRFKTRERTFASRDEAKDWIDRNQAGRRNVAPEDLEIIRGRIYNRRKKRQGERGPEKRDQLEPSFKTAEIVAGELGVSAPTIKRNGQRAEVFDAMQELGDEEAAAAAKVVPQKVIAEAKDEEPKKAAEKLKKCHVANNSGNNEWYTPPEIIEAARETLGQIDLDPASSEVAQQNVQAAEYYTVDDDGLVQDWDGRVFLNPPYSASGVQAFTEKLVNELECGNTKQAVVLVNNATETQWGQLLLSRAAAVCFVRGRIKFLDDTLTPQKTPLQGQCVFYFGRAFARFQKWFSEFGVVYKRD